MSSAELTARVTAASAVRADFERAWQSWAKCHPRFRDLARFPAAHS